MYHELWCKITNQVPGIERVLQRVHMEGNKTQNGYDRCVIHASTAEHFHCKKQALWPLTFKILKKF